MISHVFFPIFYCYASFFRRNFHIVSTSIAPNFAVRGRLRRLPLQKLLKFPEGNYNCMD